MVIPISLIVNGQEKVLEVDPQSMLLAVLREQLQLTGTKCGCGEGQCGACAVLVDGRRVLSCNTLVTDVAGKSVTTVEGLAKAEQLHPVQAAFLAEHALQCGFCTPGMIVTAIALLGQKPHPTEAEIVAAMNGNICRCCGYPRIVKAIQRAAESVQEGVTS